MLDPVSEINLLESPILPAPGWPYLGIEQSYWRSAGGKITVSDFRIFIRWFSLSPTPHHFKALRVSLK